MQHFGFPRRINGQTRFLYHYNIPFTAPDVYYYVQNIYTIYCSKRTITFLYFIISSFSGNRTTLTRTRLILNLNNWNVICIYISKCKNDIKKNFISCSIHVAEKRIYRCDGAPISR